MRANNISKRSISILLTVLLLLTYFPFASFAADVDDEPIEWHEIYTFEDLYDVRYHLDWNYKLMRNIDMTEYVKSGGDYCFRDSGWDPIGSNNIYGAAPFSGKFDGNNHIVKGLYISLNDSNLPSGIGEELFFGLFAFVTGIVKDLTVTGYISFAPSEQNGGKELRSLYAGGIAAKVGESGVVNNCVNRVRLDIRQTNSATSVYNNIEKTTESYFGGIAGFSDGIINNCYNLANILVEENNGGSLMAYDNYISGIVGFSNATVSKCVNAAALTVKTRGNPITNSYSYTRGTAYSVCTGIAAGAKNILECINYGRISLLRKDSGGYVYGIAYSKNISNCYNNGSLKNEIYSTYSTSNGFSNFTGYGISDGIGNNSDNIEFCYNTGLVNNGTDESGKAIGEKCTNCFYLDGSGISTSGAVSCTDTQLKRQITFQGWDFDNTWTMDGREDYYYPELREAPLILTSDRKPVLSGIVNISGELAPYSEIKANIEDLVPNDANVDYTWYSNNDRTQILGYGNTYDLTTHDCGNDVYLLAGGYGNCEGELCASVHIDHQEEVDLEGQPATCTESGLTDLIKCSVCGKTVSNQTVIPATGHTPEAISAVEATCTETGLTEGTKCSVCGVIITEQEIVTATGHTPNTSVRENVVDSTCSQEGSYDEVVYCKTCGDELSREEKTIEKKPHTEVVEPGTESTCTSTGLTAFIYCSFCGAIIQDQEIIQKKPHSPSPAVIENEIPSSCSEFGSYDEVVYCADCSTEISRTHKTRAKLSHTVVALPGQQPTCTQDGYSTGTMCSACGQILASQTTLSALGHNYSDWTVVQEPTCTTVGSANRKCSRCDLSETRTIEKAEHQEETIPAIPATCTATGLTEGKKCTACGEILIEQHVIAKTDHIRGEAQKENVIAATCKNEGSYESVVNCAACGVELSREVKIIPKLNHRVAYLDGVPATCTTSGFTAGSVCSDCGEIISAQQVIPANGHKEVLDAAVEPTCLKTGLTQGKHCSVCNTVIVAQEIIEKIPHTPEAIPAVVATCTKAGKTEGSKCSVCGTILTAQKTIAAKGHSWNSGKVTKAATYTATGVKTYTCTVCKATKTETIAKLKAPTVAQVTGLKTTKQTTKAITLKWSKASNANKYEIYRSADNGKTWKKIATTDNLTFTDSKLTAGAKYQYKVRGVHTASKATGKYSTVLKAGILTAAPKITKLTSTKSKTVTVTWGKVTGAKSYTVYTSTDGKTFKAIKTGATGTSATLTKLTGGKKIYIKVIAVNAYGKNSAASAVKSVTVKK